MKYLQVEKSPYSEFLNNQYIDGETINEKYKTAIYTSSYQIKHAFGDIRGFGPKRELTRGQAALLLSWSIPAKKYYRAP